MKQKKKKNQDNKQSSITTPTLSSDKVNTHKKLSPIQSMQCLLVNWGHLASSFKRPMEIKPIV